MNGNRKLLLTQCREYSSTVFHNLPESYSVGTVLVSVHKVNELSPQNRYLRHPAGGTVPLPSARNDGQKYISVYLVVYSQPENPGFSHKSDCRKQKKYVCFLLNRALACYSSAWQWKMRTAAEENIWSTAGNSVTIATQSSNCFQLFWTSLSSEFLFRESA